jgi:hypothetical protein
MLVLWHWFSITACEDGTWGNLDSVEHQHEDTEEWYESSGGDGSHRHDRLEAVRSRVISWTLKPLTLDAEA